VLDGLEHFQRLVSDPNRPFNYDEIILLVGQGNFVATLCQPTGAMLISIRTKRRLISSDWKMAK